MRPRLVKYAMRRVSTDQLTRLADIEEFVMRALLAALLAVTMVVTIVVATNAEARDASACKVCPVTGKKIC